MFESVSQIGLSLFSCFVQLVYFSLLENIFNYVDLKFCLHLSVTGGFFWLLCTTAELLFHNTFW